MTTCEPMLWYYGVILMPLFVGIVYVLVQVLVLEATVLETSLVLGALRGIILTLK